MSRRNGNNRGGMKSAGVHPSIGRMPSDFPTRLRMLREKKRQKQQVVSEMCGLHRGTIRRYERGEREPGLKELVAIADYFEVSIDYLVGRTDCLEKSK